MKRLIRSAIVILALALAYHPVQGQAPAPTTARPPASPALGRVERHIATLHTGLAITPSQQPQWDAFAAIMRANARRMENAHNEAPPTANPPNAVAAMREYAAAIRLHAEDVDRLLPALEALYATMSPDQRLKADKLFAQSRRNARRQGPG